MCCLILTAGFLGPRVALIFWWIFGDRVGFAFDSWFWPLLGLILLPWTTLAYLLVWSVVGGVEGAEWIVVALGAARGRRPDVLEPGSRDALSGIPPELLEREGAERTRCVALDQSE